jgi:hypothetical protein
MAKEADKAEEEKTDKVEDFEKRYNDSQSHITKIEAENREMREAAAKDKELFDTVSPYINWDKLNAGDKPVTEATEEEGYVDKKTLNKTIKDLQEQMQRDRITQSFRIKHPDMIPYEDLVGVFLGKTDIRRPIDERIEKAVGNVKKLIESERKKGQEAAEKEKKEKAAKEAEVDGLSGGKGSEGKEEPEAETKEDYMKGRKAHQLKAMGL